MESITNDVLGEWNPELSSSFSLFLPTMPLTSAATISTLFDFNLDANMDVNLGNNADLEEFLASSDVNGLLSSPLSFPTSPPTVSSTEDVSRPQPKREANSSDEENKKRQKRRRQTPAPTEMLNLQELDGMSGKEFDKYEQELRSKRVLTKEEEEMIRYQRRTIKGREYSQRSRQKKIQTISTLQKEVDHLNQENSELKKENATLKEKLMRLIDAIKKKDESLPAPIAMPRKQAASSFVASPSITGWRGGTCVLIVLLSIGLFVQSNKESTDGFDGFDNSSGDVTYTGRVMLATNMHDNAAGMYSVHSILPLFWKSVWPA